jgi:RNA recognition motif-containing protein
MSRHRAGASAPIDLSSSDEEDAFSALNTKHKLPPGISTRKADTSQSQATAKLPASVNSSMKRHHVELSDSRKRKMDALLSELEYEKNNISIKPHRFVPEKKGSFVEPGEELLTTNIFVGNLSPTLTEEQVAEVFRHFGEPGFALVFV